MCVGVGGGVKCSARDVYSVSELSRRRGERKIEHVSKGEKKQGRKEEGKEGRKEERKAEAVCAGRDLKNGQTIEKQGRKQKNNK